VALREEADVDQESAEARVNAARERVAVAMLRSAATHDRAAVLLAHHGRDVRAAWHRVAAEGDRAAAESLRKAS
jgi:hypothetical protein